MKYQRQLLIVGAMFFSTLIAFLLIDTFTGDRDTAKAYAEKLEKEINDLNSSIAEYRANTAETNSSLEITQLLLGEKHDELEHMNQQVRELEANIAKLEKDGKTQRRTILAMKAKLANVKEVLVQTYKAEINLLVGDLGELMRESEDMKLEKEQLQSTLKSIQSLYEECSNEKLEEQPSLDVDSVKQDNFGFFALDLKVEGVDENGKSSMKGPTIRRKATKEFLFTFDFGYAKYEKGKQPEFNIEVPSSEKKVHDLYIVLRTKRGFDTVYHPSNANSGVKFMYEGKEMISSLHIKANYQGGKTPVKAILPKDNINLLRGGPYAVFVYRGTEEGETEIIGAAQTFLN